MLRKAFIVLVLLSIAGVGLYAIVLMTRPSREVQETTEAVPSEDMAGPLEQVKKVLNLDRANDIVFGDINSGTSLLFLEKVKIEDSGFVVVYDSQGFEIENVVGFSQLLEKGSWDNVSIRLRRVLNRGETLYFGFRRDDGDGFFDMSAKFDNNITRADGVPVLIEKQVN